MATKSANPIETAERNIARLLDEAAQLAGKERALGETMLEQNQLVTSLLEEGGRELARSSTSDASTTASKLAEARAAIELSGQAIDVVRKDREPAIRAVQAAKAEVPRLQAAEKRAAAGQLLTQRRPHLEALRRIEGVDFAPPSMPARGMGGGAVGAPVVIEVAWPRSARLSDEAGGLERTAAQMERDADRVRMEGSVEASSVDGLIDAVFADPLGIGPTVPAIVEWARGAEASERARLAAWHRRHPNAVEEAHASALQQAPRDTMIRAVGSIGPELEASPGTDSITYTLVWRDGVIDTRASRARAPLVDTSSAPSEEYEEDLDIGVAALSSK